MADAPLSVLCADALAVVLAALDALDASDIPSPRTVSNPAEMTTYKNAIAMQKADYFKIKDITLSYNLPKNFIKKAYMSNARVYCSLKNFLTFSHFDNYDPERGGSVNFPLAKQVVVGINVSF